MKIIEVEKNLVSCNNIKLPVTLYLDKENAQIYAFDWDEKVPKGLLRVPYKDELYSYKKAMSEFHTMKTLDK